MKYYSALKRNKLLSHEKIWKNLKSISLSERSETDSGYMFYDSNDKLGKGKTKMTEKDQ